MARKPTIAEMGLVIDDIWDEIDDETVLTLVINGANCTGYLELRPEISDDGVIITTWWDWSAQHPRNEDDRHSGSEESLADAIKELQNAMAGIDESETE